MTPARLRWGTLLITIGLLLLLRNIGVLNDDAWIALLVYSPLVLIAIGIEKIFTRTRFQFISYATSGFLFFGGLFIAYQSGGGGPESSFFTESSHTVPFERGVDAIKARLDLDGTNLTIRDSGDDLVYAEFNRFTRKAIITETFEDDTAYIEFESRPMSFFGDALKVDVDEDMDWRLWFNEEIPLELDLTGEKSDIHLNMSTTPLRRLSLNTQDALVYLKLGELEPYVQVTINGKDSNFRLRVPQSIGLRVHGNGYKGYLERLGLTGDDDTFETDGYDTTETRVEIDLDDRLRSFSIDFF